MLEKIVHIAVLRGIHITVQATAKTEVSAYGGETRRLCCAENYRSPRAFMPPPRVMPNFCLIGSNSSNCARVSRRTSPNARIFA